MFFVLCSFSELWNGLVTLEVIDPDHCQTTSLRTLEIIMGTYIHYCAQRDDTSKENLLLFSHATLKGSWQQNIPLILPLGPVINCQVGVCTFSFQLLCLLPPNIKCAFYVCPAFFMISVCFNWDFMHNGPGSNYKDMKSLSTVNSNTIGMACRSSFTNRSPFLPCASELGSPTNTLWGTAANPLLQCAYSSVGTISAYQQGWISTHL